MMGGLKSRLLDVKSIGDLKHIFSNLVKLDPDEKWSNLHREKQKNHLYKWVGLKEGGELLEIYEAGGDEALLRWAQNKLEPMLYGQEGGQIKPEKIKLTDFIKWKNTMNVNLAGVNIEPDAGEAVKFEEHPAQWKLNKRGVDGETLIHLLLMRDEPVCTEIAFHLLKEYPGLALDIYEAEEYYGQSVLHIAIMHGDYEAVEFLLELGADPQTRATGRFFLPEDQKRAHAKKQSNYYGFAYYGEYPLAFAASFGNKDIYDSLIQRGADPNKQDIFGNSVLHICVINNSIEMYSYAVRHWAKPANVNIVNANGYTPLMLAAKLGRKIIFEEMLELMKVDLLHALKELWRFSDMACSAYPLAALDTINSDGSTNWDSALMTVIYGDTPEHLEMIEGDVVQRLLHDKWNSFAKRKLFDRLALQMLHLLTMCIAIYSRGLDDLTWSIINNIAEGTTCGGCLLFVLVYQGGQIRSMGWRGFLRNLRNTPDSVVFLLANICILMILPCRLAAQFLGVNGCQVDSNQSCEFANLSSVNSGNDWWDLCQLCSTLENALLVYALPASWLFLLFFLRGMLLTGPFVHMIYRMITGDLVRFSIITLIFLVQFSQAFNFLAQDMNRARQDPKNNDNICGRIDNNISTFPNILEAMVTMFRAAMGGYEFEEFDCAHFVNFTKVLFVIYMIIMPITLINMLIAMTGDTYLRVIVQAEKAYRRQWAQLVLTLERSFNARQLAKFFNSYSIQLNDDDDDYRRASISKAERDLRGLMVLKQTKKTKAQQRKQALANWKKLLTPVLASISQHGTEKTIALFSRRLNTLPGSYGSQTNSRLQQHQPAFTVHTVARLSTGEQVPPSPLVIVHQASLTPLNSLSSNNSSKRGSRQFLTPDIVEKTLALRSVEAGKMANAPPEPSSTDVCIELKRAVQSARGFQEMANLVQAALSEHVSGERSSVLVALNSAASSAAATQPLSIRTAGPINRFLSGETLPALETDHNIVVFEHELNELDLSTPNSTDSLTNSTAVNIGAPLVDLDSPVLPNMPLKAEAPAATTEAAMVASKTPIPAASRSMHKKSIAKSDSKRAAK